MSINTKNAMTRRALVASCLAILLATAPAFTQSIEFSFANATVGGGNLEFDINVLTDTDLTHLGTTLVLLEYNDAAFGSGIASSATVVTDAAFPIGGTYLSLSKADNSGKLAITLLYTPFTTGLGTPLSDTVPTRVFHVTIPIVDNTETSGISFDVATMAGQVNLDDNATPFDPVTAGNDLDVQLPVELTSFEATVVDGKVDLRWETASENNNSGFEVQRSVDGAVFSEIGFIEGKGNTIQPNSYGFVDSAIPANVNTLFYRLRQIDFDGRSDYSSVVEVAAPVPDKFGLKTAYPNPFNGRTVLSYDLASQSNVTLNVYDALGRHVRNLVNMEQEAGRYSVPFNASDLPSGVYIYRIEAGPFVEAGRILLVK